MKMVILDHFAVELGQNYKTTIILWVWYYLLYWSTILKSGKIIFFDQTKGEGEVFGDDKMTYYFYYTAIDGLSKNDRNFNCGVQWLSTADKEIVSKFIKGREVRFLIYTNLYMTQIEIIKIRWNRIKLNPLLPPDFDYWYPSPARITVLQSAFHS